MKMRKNNFFMKKTRFSFVGIENMRYLCSANEKTNVSIGM